MHASGAVSPGKRNVERPVTHFALSAWACLVIAVLLVACGTSTPALPTVSGGTYTSARFHFTVTYPDGWQAHEIQGSSPSTAIPLTVIITRTGDTQDNGALVSTFTVALMNAHDPTIAQGIATLEAQARAEGSPLLAIALAGKPALQAPSVKQQLPGSQLSATHTDYYLILTDYEYQLSTDAVDGDNAEPALQSMLQSFTLTK